MARKTSGMCDREGLPIFKSREAAGKAAGEDEEPNFCAWGKHWHLKTVKRRKASHGPQGGKRSGRRR